MRLLIWLTQSLRSNICFYLGCERRDGRFPHLDVHKFHPHPLIFAPRRKRIAKECTPGSRAVENKCPCFCALRRTWRMKGMFQVSCRAVHAVSFTLERDNQRLWCKQTYKRCQRVSSHCVGRRKGGATDCFADTCVETKRLPPAADSSSLGNVAILNPPCEGFDDRAGALSTRSDWGSRVHSIVVSKVPSPVAVCVKVEKTSRFHVARFRFGKGASDCRAPPTKMEEPSSRLRSSLKTHSGNSTSEDLICS